MQGRESSPRLCRGFLGWFGGVVFFDESFDKATLGSVWTQITPGRAGGWLALSYAVALRKYFFADWGIIDPAAHENVGGSCRQCYNARRQSERVAGNNAAF